MIDTYEIVIFSVHVCGLCVCPIGYGINPSAVLVIVIGTTFHRKPFLYQMRILRLLCSGSALVNLCIPFLFTLFFESLFPLELPLRHTVTLVSSSATHDQDDNRHYCREYHYGIGDVHSHHVLCSQNRLLAEKWIINLQVN